jgi:hypothetical protein
MKTEEGNTSCHCYGCVKRKLCKCTNCILSIECKISFCLFTKKQTTFECNVCFSKFRTFNYLNKHRKKTNHWKKSILNGHFPKAQWIDMYMSGVFDDDIGVRNMTKSKVVRYQNNVIKVNNSEKKYE